MRPLDHESESVWRHLEINQSIIVRMAENSRSCKVWCVTLVAATLVLVARTGQPQHALIALVPIALFWVLDAYYLGLEQRFRKSYQTFVAKTHEGKLSASDLFVVSPSGSEVRFFLGAMFKSFSVLPFYLLVTVTVVLAWQLIIPPDLSPTEAHP